MNDDLYEAYVKITLAVDSLLEFHPDFAPREDAHFSVSEAAAFEQVFVPDWDSLGKDARQYLEFLIREKPSVLKEANQALARFASLHGAEGLHPLDLDQLRAE